MDEEPNALPWKSYRDYYYVSKADLEGIGANSCFRVRCKLCAPALKTIGTNRSSSSNLRKHMKCTHPEALEEMEMRNYVDGYSGKGRRKRDYLLKEELMKRPKREELLVVGERELLFQLVEEYSSVLECASEDDDLAIRRKLMWQTLSSTFNEITGRDERTPEELKSIWETLHGRTNDDGEKECQMRPQILSTCSIKMDEAESLCEEGTLENAGTGVEPDIELMDDSHRITMAEENCTKSSMEMGYQEESTKCQNGYQKERDLPLKQAELRKRSEIDLKLQEQLMFDHEVRLKGLKEQMDLKKEILKEELEHQQKLKRMELFHKKLMNDLEKAMKQEAFRAEERRKEEKHAVEMSILRISARLTPQIRWKMPATIRSVASFGGKVDLSSSEGMQDKTKPQKNEQSSIPCTDKQPKVLPNGKNVILLQHSRPDQSFEDMPGKSNTAVYVVDEEILSQ